MLRRPTFSVAPEKVGKKIRLETRYIARSRARFLFDTLFGGRIATVPIAFGSDECTTRTCGQTAIIPFLLISGILGRLRFCTTGAYADGLPFPRQGVLPSPCVATVSDGSVVPRRRRCSPVLQRDSRVLAAAFFYGLILWHCGTIRFASGVSFCILFLTSQKKYARGATAAVSPHSAALR